MYFWHMACIRDRVDERKITAVYILNRQMSCIFELKNNSIIFDVSNKIFIFDLKHTCRDTFLCVFSDKHAMATAQNCVF